MSNVSDDSIMISLLPIRSELQRMSQVEPARMRYSGFHAHRTQAGEVGLYAYALPTDLSIEQIEEMRNVPGRINYFRRQINILQNHIEELTQENEELIQKNEELIQKNEELIQENIELRNFVREFKPNSREDIVEVNINWSHVRAVAEEAASELNWNIEISINDIENLIIVSVPEDQDDMIVDTTFDYYSLIARQLGKEVFRTINFYFISDSD